MWFRAMMRLRCLSSVWAGVGLFRWWPMPTPRQFSDMVRAGLAGDFATAKKLHYRLYELMKLIFADGSPGGIKCILKEMGICGDTVRLPLANVSKAVEEKLLAEAAKI